MKRKSHRNALKEHKSRATHLLRDLYSGNISQEAIAALWLSQVSYLEMSPSDVLSRKGEIRRKHALDAVALQQGHRSWSSLKLSIERGEYEREQRHRFIPCYQVEYDPHFRSGKWSLEDEFRGSSEFLYLPQHLAQYDNEASVYAVFEEMTGLDSSHILHFSWDETYTQEGVPWEEEEHGDPSTIEQALRIQEAEERVRACVYDQGRTFEVEFDARSWFRTASCAEILALARAQWGGEQEAEEVARFQAGKNPEIQALLTLVERKKNYGFECHVDEHSALLWLSRYRPDVHQLVLSEEPEAVRRALEEGRPLAPKYVRERMAEEKGNVYARVNIHDQLLVIYEEDDLCVDLVDRFYGEDDERGEGSVWLDEEAYWYDRHGRRVTDPELIEALEGFWEMDKLP